MISCKPLRHALTLIPVTHLVHQRQHTLIRATTLTPVFSTDDDSCSGDKAKRKKPQKAKGNRDAVRKYRQKKKAHTKHLEEEVKKLRAINQQLVEKLQGQGALEAEVLRLRTLLVDVRAKIDGALGNYPFQTRDAGNGLSCDAMAQCFLGKDVTGSCGPALMNCGISPGSHPNPH
ncbi:hypothetical protein PR202_gb16481 [Eleusine coracana subsp. coracana]|uniref:BZIP domain-containing protein n=1 Tax=Eleusine coracana subsp. coracana TaxID=191504 RepID=A0AAV5F0D8_ELECO|nr:hypothetical protein PR202_gb16481 [Eleusine coracana subsp. coracana]